MTDSKIARAIGFAIGAAVAGGGLVLLESLLVWAVLTVLVKVSLGYWQVVGGVIIVRMLRTPLLPTSGVREEPNSGD